MNLTLGVIGNPIAQSLSPLIHRGWLRDLGLDGGYMALRVDGDGFAQAMPMLVDSGYTGLNITAPHKHAAHDFAQTLSERAKAIGAVNTLSLQGGIWHGDNTDAPGVIAAISEFMPDGVAGKSVALIGAGGAARGVCYALDAAGAQLTIINRTLEKAVDLAGQFTKTNGHKAAPLADLLAQTAEADFVINTTSLGFNADPLNLGQGGGRPFYDISYGKTAAPQITAAEIEGWASFDGLPMLVYQAAFSFEIWTGQKPDIESALVRCRNALDMAQTT